MRLSVNGFIAPLKKYASPQVTLGLSLVKIKLTSSDAFVYSIYFNTTCKKSMLFTYVKRQVTPSKSQ